MKPWFFVTFNTIICHIFPETFIGIPQVVEKTWRLSLSILAIFSNLYHFFGFFDITMLQKTNEVSLYQMMSTFFHFQHTSNKLFNNCIKLYYYYTSSSWNMKWGGGDVRGKSNWTPPRKKYPQKALLGLTTEKSD